ncbi:hypothetical protein APED_22670 [Acanthopleuribacter pedis]
MGRRTLGFPFPTWMAPSLRPAFSATTHSGVVHIPSYIVYPTYPRRDHRVLFPTAHRLAGEAQSGVFPIPSFIANPLIQGAIPACFSDKPIAHPHSILPSYAINPSQPPAREADVHPIPTGSSSLDSHAGLVTFNPHRRSAAFCRKLGAYPILESSPLPFERIFGRLFWSKIAAIPCRDHDQAVRSGHAIYRTSHLECTDPGSAISGPTAFGFCPETKERNLCAKLFHHVAFFCAASTAVFPF